MPLKSVLGVIIFAPVVHATADLIEDESVNGNGEASKAVLFIIVFWIRINITVTNGKQHIMQTKFFLKYIVYFTGHPYLISFQ